MREILKVLHKVLTVSDKELIEESHWDILFDFLCEPRQEVFCVGLLDIDQFKCDDTEGGVGGK